MNSIGKPFHILSVWGIVAGMLFLIAGCATAPRIDWQARVGHYTYDQALEELGPPEKTATLHDGSLIADWLTQSSRTIISQAPASYYPYGPGPIIPPTTTVISTPEYYLRLTFDPASQLQSWKKFAQ